MSTLHSIKIGYDPSEEVEVTFNEEYIQLLEEFIEHARKLEQCRLVQAGMPFSLNININEQSGVSSTAKLPDWELVEAFLHRIRPIILQDERTNFYKICNILAKNITLAQARQQVTDERKLYQGARIHGIIQMYSNEELLTCENVLQDYLNGFEYHRDKIRQENIAKLNWLLPLESNRVLWYWLLLEKGGSIIRVAEWTRRLCDVVRQRETPPLNIHLLTLASPEKSAIANDGGETA